MKQTLSLHRVFITLLFQAVTTITWAYDFAVDGIYYDKNTDGTSVTVTYEKVQNSGYGYIKSIIIPSTVTYGGKTYSVSRIGGNAFVSSSSLTSITIPESVISIGNNAFQYCSNLTSINIPESVISIGMYAFDGTAWYKNQPNGLIYAGKVAYKYKGTMSSGTKIVIKDGTVGIAEYVFSRCYGLTVVTIPESVKNIDSYAFYDCSGLTSVTIPNSVTSIGISAFDGCSGLTSVTIGNSVTSIGQSNFEKTPWYNNQPDGLIYAGKVAYKYKGTMPSGAEIEIKEGTLGIAAQAFSHCSGLTSVTIPNSVTCIRNGAFEGCSGLTSVTIPESVTFIGSSAFAYCTGLRSVTCHAQKVPNHDGADPFFAVTQGAVTLYVPSESINAYKSANYWKNFGKILPITPTAVESLTADEASDTDKDDAIYDLNGRRMQHKPAHGFYIQGGKKYFVK